MTPDQLATAQLELTRLQLIVTALAIFLGPLAGVVFTFWFQARKDKNAAKYRLFMGLMSERKILAISRQVSAGLNTIEVVFADNSKVVGLWHKYYSLLCAPPNTNIEERAHIWLDLLTEMAKDLGYDIKTTDLDKFYLPQGHFDETTLNREMQTELLRVLKASAHLGPIHMNPENVLKDKP
jgi:hypothetical protein